MKHLWVNCSKFRVSLRKNELQIVVQVLVPELDFLRDLRNEIIALAPYIGSPASLAGIRWGISALETNCRASDSFDACDFAKVDFYKDDRRTVVLVDAVAAFEALMEKHGLQCDVADDNPAIYDYASRAKGALNVLKQVFPGD